MVSDDQFFLSQLDYSFEQSYGHLSGAMEGFLRGWYGPSDKSVVVDKKSCLASLHRTPVKTGA